MDSIRKVIELGKPVLASWSSEGCVTVVIGNKMYEYWLDAALIPELKEEMLISPWKTLNVIKGKCWKWDRVAQQCG